jgi:hypothetical protein
LKGKAEKLSEAGATSDRFEGKSRKAVRSKSTFRQVCRKKQKSCPKQEPLQIGLQEKAEKLSEARSTSDSSRENSRKPVKNQSNFRQVHKEEHQNCQKQYSPDR